jgi:hypothetical protein
LIRSRVEPQTIASETAQNANWNSHFASTVASETPMTGNADAPFPENWRKKPLLPRSELDTPSTSALPKASANPTAQ